MGNPSQISVEQLRELLREGRSFRFVDVRERDEHQVARIEGAELIPLSEFAMRAPQELRPEEKIVIHCHHGGRSMRAGQWLMQQGYTDVVNVEGGIDAWSQRVDPAVPRY